MTMIVLGDSTCYICTDLLSEKAHNLPVLWSAGNGDTYPMHRRCAENLQRDRIAWAHGFDIQDTEGSEVTVGGGRYIALLNHYQPDPRTLKDDHILTLSKREERGLIILEDVRKGLFEGMGSSWERFDTDMVPLNMVSPDRGPAFPPATPLFLVQRDGDGLSVTDLRSEGYWDQFDAEVLKR